MASAANAPRFAASSADSEASAWLIEPGHFIDTASGLVAATPEFAARAISWSRG